MDIWIGEGEKEKVVVLVAVSKRSGEEDKKKNNNNIYFLILSSVETSSVLPTYFLFPSMHNKFSCVP